MQTSRGSAPVEFILIGLPLIFLSAGTLSVAIGSYVSNVAQDVAIQAARFAALADTTLAEARLRGMENLTAALGDGIASDIELSKSGGECTTHATVKLNFIPGGLFSKTFLIEESAVAHCEIQ